MMSQHSKKELSEAIRSRYLRARKSEKERILDEFVAATGYHRKYAICILKHGPKPKGLKKKGLSLLLVSSTSYFRILDAILRDLGIFFRQRSLGKKHQPVDLRLLSNVSRLFYKQNFTYNEISERCHR